MFKFRKNSIFFGMSPIMEQGSNIPESFLGLFIKRRFNCKTLASSHCKLLYFDVYDSFFIAFGLLFSFCCLAAVSKQCKLLTIAVLQPRGNTFSSNRQNKSSLFPSVSWTAGPGAVLLWVGCIPLKQWSGINMKQSRMSEKHLRHCSIPYSFSFKPHPQTPVSAYQVFPSLALAQTLKTRALIYLYLELVILVLALLFPLCLYFVQLKMKRRNKVELCPVCVPYSVDRTAFFISFLVECSSASEI